jgi:uncharacterized protein YbjT (DUF2867 family)
VASGAAAAVRADTVVVVAAVAAAEAVMAVAADGPAGRAVMVAGATGLVGREVLAALSADSRYRAIHVVGRRAPDAAHARIRFHPVDFDRLPALPRVDDVFIALGTTIKLAGSQAAFRAIDHDAVLALARQARAAGASRLAVVSAMGADARSRVFYNRVKGETEDALRELGYETLVIARPSLLVGDRAALAQPVRLGEWLGQRAMGLFAPLIPADYRAIAASDVAVAMVRALAAGAHGTQVLLSGQMQR